MNIQCVLCINDIKNTTDRYILENSTKSGAEACRLLENLPFEVNTTPSLSGKRYVCKRCFRELKKRESIIRNLNCCEEQLGFNTVGKKKRKVSSCESVSADQRERSNDVSTPSKKGHAPKKLYFDLSPISETAPKAKSASVGCPSTKVAEQPHHGVRVSSHNLPAQSVDSVQL